MVGQQVLVLFIGVRIPIPEQYKKEQINLFFFVLFAKQRGIRTRQKRDKHEPLILSGECVVERRWARVGVGLSAASGQLSFSEEKRKRKSLSPSQHIFCAVDRDISRKNSQKPKKLSLCWVFLLESNESQWFSTLETPSQ